MSIERKLIGTTDAASGPAFYVEDVFSTYLYTGTQDGSNYATSGQTIVNNIDLAGKGGMVWLKRRSSSEAGNINDTVRGLDAGLNPSTASQQQYDINGLQGSYNSNGFTFGSNAANINYGNALGETYVSWTFRKQANFFDIVTYTGTGSARTISHALGSAPGMIIVKRTDTTGNWQVYHRSLTSAANSIQLNLTSAQASATTVWNSTAPTSTVFSVGTDATVNASGGTYVAYLFATYPGVLKVDSYIGSGTTKQIDCGFTSGARFVLIKRTDSTGDWYVWDTARGIVSANDPYLLLNKTAAEVTNTDYIDPYSAGFEISSSAPAAINASGGTYIYLAIA